MKKAKSGYAFEQAVYEFASRMDADAEVLFNYKVPDRDTGTPRQCDVWINAKFGGHFPISILVSCKDHGRKLHVGDIGNFCDEVRSTRASTGVIFAKNGFTEPALEKAKVNGLSCCRLYLNEPSELPESLEMVCFLSNPAIGLSIGQTEGIPSGLPFNEILNIPVTLPGGEAGLVLDLVLLHFYERSRNSVLEAKNADRLPRQWESSVNLGSSETGFVCDIHIQGSWKHYQSLAKATLLNGSYCLTNNSFYGWFISPAIHHFDANPGESWTQIEEDTPFPINVFIIPMERDIRHLVINHFGTMLIVEDILASS